MFLVEAYLPLTSPGLVTATVSQLRSAASAVRSGSRWVLVRFCIALPADETCFYLVEGTSIDEVRRVFDRAAVSYQRVVEAFQSGTDGPG